MQTIYRDPLEQWINSLDVTNPGVRDSIDRARAAQRLARAHALELMFRTEPGPVFDRFFQQCYAEDRQIVEALKDRSCYRRVAQLLDAEGL